MKKTPEERKKMLLLVLPAVLLIAAVVGYALYRYPASPQEKTTAQGINTRLPGAQRQKGKPETKMGVYDLAQRDSAAARSKTSSAAFAALGWGKGQFAGTTAAPQGNTAASEAQISQKLAEISKQVNAPQAVNTYSPPEAPSPDLDKLEKLLKQKQQASAPDPEMAQLNTMLDKIQQIQNPALAKEKQEAAKPAKPDSAFKAIPAVIDGSQKVAPGGVVKLKLADTLRVGGLLLPKGQALSGACAVTNQRLLLDIKNIRLGTSIIPVSLTVFSLDGMPGIAAPEAELGEARAAAPRTR